MADLDAAIQAFDAATAEIAPDSHGRPLILDNLADTLAKRYAATTEVADLERAINVWEQARSFLQKIFITIPVSYKLGQQRDWTGIYASLATAHIQWAKVRPDDAIIAYRRAFEAAESAKARFLMELTGRGDLPVPPSIPLQQAGRERELLTRCRALDVQELARLGLQAMSTPRAGVTVDPRQRREYQQELEQLWKEMERTDPESAEYVALRRGDPPTWEDLAGLAEKLGHEAVLVSLFVSTERTLLFILRARWERPEVVEEDLDAAGWQDLLGRFFREVHAYEGGSEQTETWDTRLRPVLKRVAVHLVGATHVIIAPHGPGHLIPWAVLAGRAGWRTPSGQTVATVTLPALGLLPRLRQRQPHQGGSALVAGNPTGDLKHAEEEAKQVASKLGTSPLLRSQATRTRVLALLPEATVVHLATHAAFALDSPLDSAIELADGLLRARDVLAHRLKADLLVLSACQTGMAQSLGGDELAGLAHVFLQAGARSLLVSLWEVNDPSTAGLMITFYNARETGKDKAEALTEAMSYIQAQQEWRHSYFWGGFMLMGDW